MNKEDICAILQDSSGQTTNRQLENPVRDWRPEKHRSPRKLIEPLVEGSRSGDGHNKNNARIGRDLWLGLLFHRLLSGANADWPRHS